MAPAKKTTSKTTAKKTTAKKKPVAKKTVAKKATTKKTSVATKKAAAAVAAKSVKSVAPKKKAAPKKTTTKTKAVVKTAAPKDKKCCCGNIIATSIATFIFIFIFEYLWHGVVLTDLYIQTSDLWRTPAEMQDYFQYAFLTQISLAVLLTFIFGKKYEKRGLMEGARFGLYAGLFIGIMQSASYAYMPVPGALAFLWLVGGILEGIGIGITISAIYKQK